MSPRDPETPPDDTLDPETPPTEAELAAAEALRRAFDLGATDRGSDARADWDLVEAVRAAASPGAISREKHRHIVERALEGKTRGRVIRVAFGGVASLVAMAAALAIVMRAPPRATMEPTAALPKMALSRSTVGLFPDGIPPKGGTSDRVDRIAYARARDLRENRFARWGVR